MAIIYCQKDLPSKRQSKLQIYFLRLTRFWISTAWSHWFASVLLTVLWLWVLIQIEVKIICLQYIHINMYLIVCTYVSQRCMHHSICQVYMLDREKFNLVYIVHRRISTSNCRSRRCLVLMLGWEKEWLSKMASPGSHLNPKKKWLSVNNN